MKYFGEFLVEKNLISVEKLTEALVEQVSQLPPACELAFKKQLLTPDQILTAFKVQSESGVDFIQACKQLNFWTTQIENQINQEISQLRIPLGQILAKKAYIDLPTLTKNLDLFLAQAAKEGAKAPERTPVAAAPVAVAPIATTPIAAALGQSQVESNTIDTNYPKLDPESLNEFTSQLTQAKFNILMATIRGVGANLSMQDVAKANIVEIKKFLHTIKGVCRLYSLKFTEDLVASIEYGFSYVEENLASEKLSGFFTIAEQAMNEVWRLRSHIAKNATEEDCFSVSQSKENYDLIMKQIGEFKK